MTHPGRIARTLALSMLTLLALGRAALAEDAWRLAGTFNGWNTADDAYALEPVGDEPGVLAIERRFRPGDYVFKFVRNGDWGEGHLGLEAGDALEQPGADIPLSIPADAVYRVELDTVNNRWSLRAVNLKAPIPIVAIRGVPTLGRPFEVDLRQSLTNLDQDKCSARIYIPGTIARARRATDNSLRWQIIPADIGRGTLNVTLYDGVGEGVPETTVEVPIFIRQRFFIALEYLGNDGALIQRGIDANPFVIWPLGGDLYRTLIDIPEDGIVNSGDVFIQDKNGTFIQVRSNGPIRKGRYLVEIDSGQITQHDDEQTSPRVLIPGNWERFVVKFPKDMAAPAKVFLTGDFNGWARPGEPDAIELTPMIEQQFMTIIDVPAGSHRYQFVYGGQGHADPENPSEALAPDGTPSSVIVVGPKPEDFAPAVAGEINERAVRHDPDSARDFAPISPGLGLVDVGLSTLPGDAESVVLYATTTDERGGVEPLAVPMRRSTDFAGFDRWTARLRTGQRSFTYTFSVLDGDAEYLSPTYTGDLPPDPLKIPDWAMGAVWYQIFAERFRNGNPLNDPSGESVFLKEWASDWYTVTPDEEAAWRERYDVAPDEPMPERVGGPLYHVVFDRRYGGDLQGVAEKLDELEGLGVTAIYFNPVFEAESMHKYDATDFRHIDDNSGAPASAGRTPDLWTVPEGETLDPETWVWTPADRYFIDEFLPAARARGIRVVIDGVFNHTGRRFFAFQDVLENGKDSPYADWYYVEFDDDGNVASWTAWDGPSGWLPKFRQTPEGDLVAPVKKHLFEITERWMDPNGDGDPSDGVDGWRLDVPLDIGGAQGAPFWKSWRTHVKRINPDAIIIAEIWDDPGAAPFLRGDHFDTQMHYPFATAVTEWLAVKPGMTATELAQRLDDAFDDAPQTNLVHQNLFSSHDTDRYVSKLLNPGRSYDGGNRIQDGDRYDDSRPPDEIYDLSMVGVAIQATYLGAPMIYYGAEYGMWGADDPTDRKPLPWPDAGENLNPTDNVVEGVRDRYARWFNLRSEPTVGPILRYGDLRHLDTGDPGVFAFERALNGDRVVVVANREATPFDASALVPDGASDAGDTTVAPRSARFWLVERDSE